MAESPPTLPAPRRWPWRVGAVGVGLATLTLMLLTEPRLSIVWDEGFTLGREARIRDWFRAIGDPKGFAATWTPPSPRLELVQQDGLAPPKREEIDTRAKLLSPRVLAWFWPFAREEPHGHPPFYAIEGLIGDWLVPHWETLSRARLGPILGFSLAAGAIFGFLGRRWGFWAGALASGSWAFQPNLFAHGHYATVDGLLASLWVGSMLAFALAVEREGRSPRWGWAIVFGILCGWAADSKLTGWFLPIPFLVWSVLYRDRRGFLTLLIGGLVGVVILFAFNPCWWADPISGVARFLRSNLTRGRTIPIPVEFLGQIYDTPRQSLPWYNTIVWTVFVTPIGFLVLGVIGAILGVGAGARRVFSNPKALARSFSPFAALAALHWGFLLALRAMPNTPGHDGVRLFLPAFGVLAVLAGVGGAWLVEKWQGLGKGLVALAILEGVASVALMMPVPLSYFSPAVGGPQGAYALGMEPTYFWDGLTVEAVDWLNAHTPTGRSVAFATFPHSWLYLKQSGRFRFPLFPIDREPPAWFVIQNRRSAFGKVESDLIRNGKPAYVVRKLGVPIVLIYPYPG